MGTIGHDTLLHKMKMWQVRAAIRGNFRKNRTTWESTRMHAWLILSALGSKVNSPAELIPFPWDNNSVSRDMKEEEYEALQKLISDSNK